MKERKTKMIEDYVKEIEKTLEKIKQENKI